MLSCGTGYVEESDNVFTDDCNFSETGKTSERLDVDEENVPIKEQIVSGNPWAGSTRGSVLNHMINVKAQQIILKERHALNWKNEMTKKAYVKV